MDIVKYDEYIGKVTEIKGNEKQLDSLIDRLQADGITPFVGAGLSMPFGCPSWRDFLRQAAEDKPSLLTTIDEFLDKDHFEAAADFLYNELGGWKFDEILSDSFGDPKLSTRRLDGAISLLPRITKGAVVTTNFDRLLEQVYLQESKPFVDVVLGARKARLNRILQRKDLIGLLKIHGDVFDPDYRILTAEQYRQHYGTAKGVSTRADLPAAMAEILSKRPALFLGCSLVKDRVMLVLRQITKGRAHVRHFAVLPVLPDDAAQQRREKYLVSHQVSPIWYPDGEHECVEAILKHLCYRVQPDTSALSAIIGKTAASSGSSDYPVTVLCTAEQYENAAIQLAQLAYTSLIWTSNGSPLKVEAGVVDGLTDWDREFANLQCTKKKRRVVIFRDKREWQRYIAADRIGHPDHKRRVNFTKSVEAHGQLFFTTRRILKEKFNFEPRSEAYDIGYVANDVGGREDRGVGFHCPFASSDLGRSHEDAGSVRHMTFFPLKHGSFLTDDSYSKGKYRGLYGGIPARRVFIEELLRSNPRGVHQRPDQIKW